MRQKGFTLIEILLSATLLSLLVALSFPVYQSFQNKNDMDIIETSIAQSMRRAQVLSQNMDGDSTWGVKVQGGSVTVFKGASFAVRDTTYDEVFDVASTIVFSGINEIVFAKLTGLPSTSGTINIASTLTSNETRAVTVNSEGMVDF